MRRLIDDAQPEDKARKLREQRAIADLSFGLAAETADRNVPHGLERADMATRRT